jgi:hypothetical protein
MKQFCGYITLKHRLRASTGDVGKDNKELRCGFKGFVLYKIMIVAYVSS